MISIRIYKPSKIIENHSKFNFYVNFELQICMKIYVLAIFGSEWEESSYMRGVVSLYKSETDSIIKLKILCTKIHRVCTNLSITITACINNKTKIKGCFDSNTILCI